MYETNVLEIVSNYFERSERVFNEELAFRETEEEEQNSLGNMMKFLIKKKQDQDQNE